MSCSVFFVFAPNTFCSIQSPHRLIEIFFTFEIIFFQTNRWHACYGLCWENERDKDPNNVLSIQRVSRYPEVSQVSDKGLLTFNIDGE